MTNPFEPKQSEWGKAPVSSKVAAAFDPVMVVKEELERGEKLIWADQPVAGRLFAMALPIFVFAIPWTAFSLFWEAMALGIWLHKPEQAADDMQKVLGIVFPLFGLPFVLIGFGMLSAPFVLLARARKTVYAITDRRILIVTTGNKGRHKVESRALKDIRPELSRKENKDGAGSLFLGSAFDMEQPFAPNMKLRGFEQVRHVREVEAKLRRAIEDDQRRRKMFGRGEGLSQKEIKSEPAPVSGE
ncbi:MAG: hypothetical protein EOM37_06645 [Proteobacteria bacterium]|jgi:hypothetical protein|nr:hypothetical protein [Alphaproteobacteria bacterium]NCC03705.1 hypothetical protein [Pseudomonadota bacterium]